MAAIGHACARSVLAAILGIGLVAAILVKPDATQASASPRPVCGQKTAATESAALAAAVACGQPVVADSSRTEFSQVLAQPDGRLTFESAAVPQRTRGAGGWIDIDLRLTRGADGRWRPAASVADVSFSAGGGAELVILSRDGHRLALSWPGTLPAPVVSGDSATYREVLPEVDLVVRATRTGFTHTLVVKSAAAAANPAIRAVRFALGGDVRLRRLPDGGLRASAGDVPVAEAPPALMWDSRVGPAESAGIAATRSSASGAGDAARLAAVRTEPVAGGLLLHPDPALLDAPDRAFPLYIDPDWSVAKTAWAYATNNGSGNSDISVARVGRNPDNGVLFRSYFRFPLTANGVFLGGKHIQSARVEMNLDHSWSCGNTPAAMYLTNSIASVPKETWSRMGLNALLAVGWGHANEAGGCGTIQPDMIMNFSGAALTSQMQAAASVRWGEINFAFTARDGGGAGESNTDRWKKFHPNDAKLFVDYDSIPTPPADLQVASVACPANTVISVGTLNPTLSAVLPDADSQTLLGYFEYVEVPASGNPDEATVKLKPPGPDPFATANTRATSAPITIVAGKTYAFHVTVRDPAPYERWSGWGPWCKFAADTTVPPAPTVSAGTAPGPGRPVTFTLSTTTPDVVKFRYGWSSPPATEVAATGTATKTATVTLTAPGFGKNTLWVRAVDAIGNLGNLTSLTVTVGRPTPPVAHWGLESYPGLTQAQALTDRQPALGGDTPLTHNGIGWTPDVHLLGGQSATFNRAAYLSTAGPVVNTAGSYSVAARVRLADANPATPEPDLSIGNWTAVGQSGNEMSPFYLGYRIDSGIPTWGLLMTAADDDLLGHGTHIASATRLTAADIGKWFHLAAVHDATAREVRLYVDGVLAASAALTRPVWNAGGPLTVGAVKWTPPNEQPRMVDSWAGQIADVQVFDRVLVADDFTGLAATDPRSGGFHEPGILNPIQVGGWNFNAAVPCYTTDLADTCEAPDGSTAFGRWLALTRGADVGAGQSGQGAGLWLDSQYFPEEGQTGVTDEYGRSARKTGLTPPDANGNRFTLWQDAPVLRTSESFTIAAWVTLNRLDANRTAVSQRGTNESAAGIGYDSASGKWQLRLRDEDTATSPQIVASSTSPASAGAWTHLTGVYDGSRKHLRLYVNGVAEAVVAVPFAPMVSSGPLLAGRALRQGQLSEPWDGGIDDLSVHQGALTDTAVSVLYNSQILPGTGANALTREQRLTSGQTIRSDAGNFLLRMQDDGNLVLTQNGIPLWDTRTWGNPEAYLHMQSDGNAVVYRADRTPLWDTRTWGTAGDRFVLRDDGDLVLLDPSGRVQWHR